jgi:hypothetical protein
MTIRRSEAEDYRPLIEERMFVRSDLEFESEDLTAEDLATAVALRKALKKYKLKHAVSFHSRNQLAADFVEIQRGLNGAGLSASLKTFRVSSDISTGKRHEQLKGFQEAKKALISNARCLTEGVDVPGIDLVLFAQARQSKVDIVQAVGRALRVPSDQPDKRGYVLVPVLVDDDDEDIENVVEGTGFENLVSVLKAMATVDEDITDRIEVVVGKPVRRGLRAEAEADVTDEALPVRMDVERFAESLRLRAWDRLEGLKRSRLTIEQILEWADAFHNRMGKWPQVRSGPILGVSGMSWSIVDNALTKGLRGLPGGSSLLKFLAEQREVRNAQQILLSIDEILEWADSHYTRMGTWPTNSSGEIPEAPGETWAVVSGSLQKGQRGLKGGITLSQLLFEERGVHDPMHALLTEGQILEWADDHYERTGRWPTRSSGKLVGCPEERWNAIDQALKGGGRGLSGGSSLSALLQKKRGRRNIRDLPTLSIDVIMSWADTHFQQTGKWPNQFSGTIGEVTGETWSSVNGALIRGTRGLPGGGSLAKLIVEERGVPLHNHETDLAVDQILKWADGHFARTGDWPKENSGAVEGTSENWNALSAALRNGVRGLSGGSSLAKLLFEARGVRYKAKAPRLTEAKILNWADAHYEAEGKWPTLSSGKIRDAPDENWANIDNCLSKGRRGLSGETSLSKLLEKERDVRNPKNLPKLTEEKILGWADAHRKRTGNWPRVKSGDVRDAPGETWSGIRTALRMGNRGLPGGSSLAKLIAKYRGK